MLPLHLTNEIATAARARTASMAKKRDSLAEILYETIAAECREREHRRD